MAENENEMPETVPGLVVELMRQNAVDLAHTTNALVDGLTSERDELRATLDAVRTEIKVLLSSPWAPSSHALLNALWPDSETVNAYRPKKEKSVFDAPAPTSAD